MVGTLEQTDTICWLLIQLTFYLKNIYNINDLSCSKKTPPLLYWPLVRIGFLYLQAITVNTFQFLPFSVILQNSNITTTTELFHSI